MIRVFVADDHEVVRLGLRRLIDEEEDMTVVGEAKDGRQVLLAEGKEGWDVLVLDLGLPRVSGMEVLRRLQQEHPALRVIVVSMFPEAHYADRVLALGACGYLAKERPALEVIAAIRAAAASRTYIGGGGVVAGESQAREGAFPHAELSAREYQIFLLVCQGHSTSEIAAELNVTASTVSTHLLRVKQKLSVRTAAEIVAYAHRVGLLGGT